jgi:flagellar motor switch protein FliG
LLEPSNIMLTNAEKAVLFLLSLDEEVARPIVAELGEEEIKKLRSVASTMRQVPKDAIDLTFREFLERSNAAVAVPRGGLPYLRRLSSGALGEERTRAVFEDGITSPLTRLERARPEDVAALLENEPPQLAAAVLSLLAPKSASPILFAMSEERQAAVVKHVGRLTQVPAKALEEVANALSTNLPAPTASTLVSIDGVAKAAELLNTTSKGVQENILQSLDAHDPTLATDVRQAMFTFDDLVRVPARQMRTLVREVPSDRLVLALKNASEALLGAVLAGLSSRAAQLLRDDLEMLTSARKSDIITARKEVVAVALRLEAEGQLDLGRGDGA